MNSHSNTIQIHFRSNIYTCLNDDVPTFIKYFTLYMIFAKFSVETKNDQNQND